MISSAVFAQEGIQFPASPSMPKISSPTIENGFYSPGRSDFYSPGISVQTEKSQKTESKKSAETETRSAANLLTAERDFGNLSAKDIVSLAENGALLDLPSFYNSSSLNAAGLVSSADDTRILREILVQLDELKKSVAQPDKNESGKIAQKKSYGEILRFSVNGRNLLSSFGDVYFSKAETDGTFLLTGDRTYTSNGGQYSETFHLLFHSAGNSGGSTDFSVAAEVFQNRENEDSLVYRLSKQENLTAKKTGNLVTLKVSAQDFKADILLSLNGADFS